MLASLLFAIVLSTAQGAAEPLPNPLELNAEMRRFLDKNVDRNLPPLGRLQALDIAVFRDNALGFSYRDETRTAAETFTSHNGNCLSFTLMFIAMARYVGLDARFREVDIAPTFSMTGKYSTLHQHLNAAVVMTAGFYVMDVFPGVNRVEIGGRLVTDARGLAHYYNNKAVDELGKGNIQGAESYLKAALESDPTTASALVNSGVIKMQEGRVQEAEGYYRKALESDKHDAAAMGNLVILLEHAGRLREANRYRAKAKAVWEKNPYRFFGLGMAAFEAGRYEESIQNYKRALKLKDKEHNFYFAMARSYLRLSQNEEAMKNLVLAAKYAPDSSKKDRYNQKLELLKSLARTGTGS
jgi:tetratricopeptide (TPR) repeat protein